MSDFASEAATLPASSEHAQHNLFTRERQIRFLEALSVSGNVRAACRSACISPQSAYRLRRADAQFARAWTAACLAARAHVEAVLADRALNGVEEAVFYHGEEVARRRRYDSRLLLAHLARLDKLAESEELAELAGDYDNALDAFRAHGTLAPPPNEPPPAPPRDEDSGDDGDDGEYDDGEYGGSGEEDDGGEDYGCWRTRQARASGKFSSGPSSRSARELQVPDLYRLADEDFAFLYERLMAQKDAAPAPEPQPAPQPETPPAPDAEQAPPPRPEPKPDSPPAPIRSAAAPHIIDFPTGAAPLARQARRERSLRF